MSDKSMAAQPAAPAAVQTATAHQHGQPVTSSPTANVTVVEAPGRLAYKWRVLISVLFGIFMIILDSTVVNVAFQTLRREFSSTLAAADLSPGNARAYSIGKWLCAAGRGDCLRHYHAVGRSAL